MLPTTGKKGLQIYVSFPFCFEKCHYCNHLVIGLASAPAQGYFEALKKEITGAASDAENYQVKTITLGGGTPTLVRPDKLVEIVKLIKSSFDVDPEVEVTVEANPGSMNPDMMAFFRMGGIQRLSIGLETTNFFELRDLGRPYDYFAPDTTHALIEKFQFQNVNYNILYGIPGQTLVTWEQTLAKAVKLNAAHVSVYPLVIAKGTPFYEVYGDGWSAGAVPAKALPDAGQKRKMFEFAQAYLEANGYHQYSLYHFAKDGFESKQVHARYDGMDYMGFGLGAVSSFDGVSFSNTQDLNAYIQHSGDYEIVCTNIKQLDEAAQMSDFVCLGLTRTNGISTAEFEARFETPYQDVYGDATQELVDTGLLQRENGMVCLTAEGLRNPGPVFHRLAESLDFIPQPIAGAPLI